MSPVLIVCGGKGTAATRKTVGFPRWLLLGHNLIPCRSDKIEEKRIQCRCEFKTPIVPMTEPTTINMRKKSLLNETSNLIGLEKRSKVVTMPVTAHVRKSSVARINHGTTARNQPRNHWSEQTRRLGPGPVEPARYPSCSQGG